MAHVENDTRSPERKALDEQIANDPHLARPNRRPGATPMPVEAYLKSQQRPVAFAGVVENGLVRPLDPSVRLPEHARVIIVASEPE